MSYKNGPAFQVHILGWFRADSYIVTNVSEKHNSLPFSPEDRDSMFLRSACVYFWVHTPSQPRTTSSISVLVSFYYWRHEVHGQCGRSIFCFNILLKSRKHDRVITVISTCILQVWIAQNFQVFSLRFYILLALMFIYCGHKFSSGYFIYFLRYI
jgi:hypothetical protein